jgi:hypothetical protein
VPIANQPTPNFKTLNLFIKSENIYPMVDNNLEKLCLQKFSLVRATNSNSRGDQSPFNLFDSPVALNPQPSSTMTMQEVTHSTTVPYSLNITLSQNHDSLNKSFLTTVAMVFSQLREVKFQRKYLTYSREISYSFTCLMGIPTRLINFL